MTITLHWWLIPTALFFGGIVLFLICEAWGERQGGGMLSGLAEGLIGIALCLICWTAAMGIVIGRWLA